MVLERRLASPELVERPVAGVEARQERLGRGLEPGRERGGVGVAGRRRVVADRDRALELRVQHRGLVEAVQPDPGAARELAHERARDRAKGAAGRLGVARIVGEGERARERLGHDGLRHPGRPRRLPTSVRELVLPAERAAGPDRGPREQRRRECSRPVSVLRGDGRVQRARVRERVELEAVAREEAVDDPVLVRDVGAGGGSGAVAEVRRVLGEHREERQGARGRVGAPLDGHVVEHAAEIRLPRPAEVPEDGDGTLDLRAVGVGVLRAERPGLHRPVEAPLGERRVRVRARAGGRGHGCERDGKRRPHRLRRGSTAKSRE